MLVITITIENPEASIMDASGNVHKSSTTITKVLETTSELSSLLYNIRLLSNDNLVSNECYCEPV